MKSKIWAVALGGLMAVSTMILTRNVIQYGYTEDSYGVRSEQRKPHIVMVVADDLGWNDIGYHNRKIKTPTLDGLAKNGVKLENYYVQPICSPSRVQILSGKYQIHMGLQHKMIFMGQAMGMPVDSPTIGDQLQAQGYSTHAVGKWHAGYYTWDHMPTRRGFHSFLGHLGSRNDYYTTEQCADFPDGKSSCGLAVYDNETVFHGNEEYSAHFYTRRAQQIIQRRPRDKPLFIYLAYQNVHRPLQVPQHYEDMYPNIDDDKRRKYAGMVSCMDEGIRNVTETLKAEGMWDDTVFIFTTDNGGCKHAGGNNWPLRGAKNSYWEGGIRGVSLVHSPGYVTQPGRTSHGLMHVSDWYPTLLHLAGGQKLHSDLDGYNVWDMISMGKDSKRSEILHNIDPMEPLRGEPMYKSTFDTRYQGALRVNEWKLLTGQPGRSDQREPPPESTDLAPRRRSKRSEWDRNKNVWLFNITADPYEQDDLSSSYPEVVVRMLDKLAAYNKTALPCSFPDVDPNSHPDLHGGAWAPWIKSDISISFKTRGS